MTLVGNIAPLTADEIPLQPDTVYTAQSVTLLAPQAIAKWSVWLGGIAPGTGTLRGVIINAASQDVVAVGQEVALDGHAPEGWVDLPAAAEVGAVLPPGEYLFGFWYGGSAGALSAAGVSGSGAISSDPVPYDSTNAPASPLPTQLGQNPCVFALVFDAWQPRPAMSYMELGRLPWEMSQRALGVPNTPKKAPPTVPGATCGWHGVNFDVETGAFAIARTGGLCEDLVGYPVLITRRHGLYVKTCCLYCYLQRPFPAEVADEDLSITRRAWLAISDWADDTQSVDCLTLPT